MRCSICGVEIDSIDEAIDEGWITYFYDGGREHQCWLESTACRHFVRYQQERASENSEAFINAWERGLDLNQGPSGYELPINLVFQ
jgi:hypothetical protein